MVARVTGVYAGEGGGGDSLHCLSALPLLSRSTRGRATATGWPRGTSPHETSLRSTPTSTHPTSPPSTSLTRPRSPANATRSTRSPTRLNWAQPPHSSKTPSSNSLTHSPSNTARTSNAGNAPAPTRTTTTTTTTTSSSARGDLSTRDALRMRQRQWTRTTRRALPREDVPDPPGPRRRRGASVAQSASASSSSSQTSISRTSSSLQVRHANHRVGLRSPSC